MSRCKCILLQCHCHNLLKGKKQCKHIGVKFLGIWILVTCSEIFPNIGYFLLLSQLCASLAPIILYHNCYGCPDILLLLCCIYYFEVLRDYCISLRWTFSLIFFLFAKIQCCHQAIIYHVYMDI